MPSATDCYVDSVECVSLIFVLIPSLHSGVWRGCVLSLLHRLSFERIPLAHDKPGLCSNWATFPDYQRKDELGSDTEIIGIQQKAVKAKLEEEEEETVLHLCRWNIGFFCSISFVNLSKETICTLN